MHTIIDEVKFNYHLTAQYWSFLYYIFAVTYKIESSTLCTERQTLITCLTDDLIAGGVRNPAHQYVVSALGIVICARKSITFSMNFLL